MATICCHTYRENNRIMDEQQMLSFVINENDVYLYLMWVIHPCHFVMTFTVKFSVTFYNKLLEPQRNTNRNNTYKLSLSYML
jgi:hypothetical protein